MTYENFTLDELRAIKGAFASLAEHDNPSDLDWSVWNKIGAEVARLEAQTPLTSYRLPNGDTVAIREDVARGERFVSFEMKGTREIVTAERV